MDLGLGGAVAVVTGASRGIGLAVTRALVAEGAYVAAGARHSSEELDGLARDGSVRVVAVDLGTAAWFRRSDRAHPYTSGHPDVYGGVGRCV